MTDQDRRYFDPELNPPILDEVAAMVEWRRSGRDAAGWRREHALGQWHRHARAFEAPAFDAQRPAYERAIAFGLGRLQRFATFEALVDHYFDDRHSRRGGKHRGMVPVDPIAGTVERWVAEAIAHAGDDELNRPFVEELAFGRRAQQLIEQGAAPSSSSNRAPRAEPPGPRSADQSVKSRRRRPADDTAADRPAAPPRCILDRDMHLAVDRRVRW